MSYMYMIKQQYMNGYFEYIENLINNNENLSELFKLHKINLLSLYNYAPYLFVCATSWPNKVGTKQCATCDGTGAKPGTEVKPCQHCGGAGHVMLRQGPM